VPELPDVLDVVPPEEEFPEEEFPEVEPEEVESEEALELVVDEPVEETALADELLAELVVEPEAPVVEAVAVELAVAVEFEVDRLVDPEVPELPEVPEVLVPLLEECVELDAPEPEDVLTFDDAAVEELVAPLRAHAPAEQVKPGEQSASELHAYPWPTTSTPDFKQPDMNSRISVRRRMASP
jgi:hypothetical protein